MSADRIRYFDSSALVKLLREEPETAAVRALDLQHLSRPDVEIQPLA